MLKRWSIWMPISYSLVSFISMYDETLILFFIISPPFWLAETHWFVVNVTHPSNIPIPLFFLVGVLFWFFIGLLIDGLIKKIKRLYLKVNA